MAKKRQGTALAFFLIVLVSGVFPEEAYLLIKRLNQFDEGFKQYIREVEENRRRLFNRERTSGEESIAGFLTIYRYLPSTEDDIFSLAGRCNIPYASLASLNRINHPSSFGQETLLLPSVPGIFVPEKPETDFERLLASARGDAIPGERLWIREGGQSRPYIFYPGDDFSQTERIFFLNSGFRFPLRDYRISSLYGVRRNPVTGRIRFHQGIDLAAPEGSPVYVCAAGTVTEIGEDPVYGNFIIVKHGDNWASLYGHLSKIETSLRSELRSGTLIGRVGSTGQSTGPHLHFELRRNGRAEDPGRLLFRSFP
ncbi:MAG: M23 family metallopeptidase [Treponema sp.]|nr:M23 family metallopeptidase [Treponema sp.]